MAISLINIIDANQRKRYSNNLFREKFFDLLLEAKRRGLLYDKPKELEKEIQRRRENHFNDEDNYKQTNIRRKVVGLGDNPF